MFTDNNCFNFVVKIRGELTVVCFKPVIDIINSFSNRVLSVFEFIFIAEVVTAVSVIYLNVRLIVR